MTWTAYEYQQRHRERKHWHAVRTVFLRIVTRIPDTQSECHRERKRDDEAKKRKRGKEKERERENGVHVWRKKQNDDAGTTGRFFRSCSMDREEKKLRTTTFFHGTRFFFCLFFLAGSKQATKGNSGKISPSFSRCNVVFVASRWLPSIKTRRVLLKGNPTPCMAIYIVVDGRICQWEIEIFRVEVTPLHFASLSFNYDTG